MNSKKKEINPREVEKALNAAKYSVKEPEKKNEKTIPSLIQEQKRIILGNQIAIVVAIASFLMSLCNLIWK